jgi:hypothetical protein
MEVKKPIITNQILTMMGLIIIGIVGRYALFGMGVQPFPNFEIIMVLTFLAAMLIKPSLAIVVPLVSMIGSDILIGNPIFVGSQMNRIVLFTYSGFAMIGLINVFNRERFNRYFGELRLRNVGIAAGLGVGFVLVYDLWTNLGWWYLMYPHTASSFAVVFTSGIPFMIYHLVSGLVTFVVVALPIMVYIHQKSSTSTPLERNIYHKLPIIAVVLCLLFLSFTGTAVEVPEKSEVWFEYADETSVVLVINGEGWNLKENVVAYEDDTVFSLLQRSLLRNDITFEYTYYEEFDSLLIDSIFDDVNGDEGKYWQYYVNGDLPIVGADNLRATNGDTIEWRFEVIPY